MSSARQVDRRVWAVSAALLSALSVVFPLIAIPAAFLMLLGAVVQRAPSRGLKIILAMGAFFSLVAMVRFTIEEAAPGIIEGGRRAQGKKAVSHLRQLVFAQDVGREQAWLDPDEDGVGSALGLKALTGGDMRSGAKPRTPLLARFGRLVEEPSRVYASIEGYGIVLYLPTEDGKASPTAAAAIADEAAERRYVAYAWPLRGGHGDRTVIFVDEHERILVSNNQGADQGYVGPDRPPPFDAALTGPTIGSPAARSGTVGHDGGVWTAWKDKRPRAKLPGAD